MENIGSYLLSNAYSSVSPLINTAAAVCSVNGQNVACPNVDGLFGGLIVLLGGMWIVMFIVLIIAVIGMWKVFEKAGRPGWASIIPVYNNVVMLEIINKPIWWIVLMFVPFVNIIIGFIVIYNLAKAFGKDIGFTIGLILLPFIFFPILGFGKSVYMGSGNSSTPSPTVPPSAATFTNAPTEPPQSL